MRSFRFLTSTKILTNILLPSKKLLINNQSGHNFKFYFTQLQLQQLRSFKPLKPLPRSGQDEWAELAKLSITKRLKILIKKYWYVAIPLHMANSLAWFGGLYLICRLYVYIYHFLSLSNFNFFCPNI